MPAAQFTSEAINAICAIAAFGMAYLGAGVGAKLSFKATNRLSVPFILCGFIFSMVTAFIRLPPNAAWQRILLIALGAALVFAFAIVRYVNAVPAICFQRIRTREAQRAHESAAEKPHALYRVGSYVIAVKSDRILIRHRIRMWSYLPAIIGLTAFIIMFIEAPAIWPQIRRPDLQLWESLIGVMAGFLAASITRAFAMQHLFSIYRTRISVNGEKIGKLDTASVAVTHSAAQYTVRLAADEGSSQSLPLFTTPDQAEADRLAQIVRDFLAAHEQLTMTAWPPAPETAASEAGK